MQPSCREYAIAQITDIMNDALVEQVLSHLLMDQYIDFLSWSKIPTAGFVKFDRSDPVALRNGLRRLDDVGVIERVDFPGALRRGEKRQDAGAGPEIDHDIAFLHLFGDGAIIGIDAQLIAQHALMLIEGHEDIAIARVDDEFAQARVAPHAVHQGDQGIDGAVGEFGKHDAAVLDCGPTRAPSGAQRPAACPQGDLRVRGAKCVVSTVPDVHGRPRPWPGRRSQGCLLANLPQRPRLHLL